MPAILLASRAEGDERGSFVAFPGSPVVSDELLVEFRDEISGHQRSATLSSLGVVSTKDSLPGDFAVLEVPRDARLAVGEALANSGLVETVEEVLIRTPAAIPNDYNRDRQWNMRHIGMEQAWGMNDGSGVVVAVVDTGVAHENFVEAGVPFGKGIDLAQAGFVAPWDAVAEDPHANDEFGHGTHVAGTIAQSTGNGVGVAGIAPGAQIMPVKVCAPIPPSDNASCLSTDIAEGISWAIEHGADVINLSIEGTGSPCNKIQEIEKQALQNASDAGIVVIGAAGNGVPLPSGERQGVPQLCFPASVPTVISVGAVDKFFNRAPYSNYGVNEDGSDFLDLVAPGGNPYASEDDRSYIWQETYFYCQKHPQIFTEFYVAACVGTSMAAAHVSGVAALVRSHYPLLNATQVRTTLRDCALDLGTTGPDSQYGRGLVRANEVLRDFDGDKLPDCIDEDVATPTPSPSEPPTPSPTPEPPANACLPPPTPDPTPTPEATATSQETPTEVDTSVPTPSPLQPVGQGASETPSPTESGIDGPSPTPTIPATDGPTTTASPTPTPTPTPSPSPTPSPVPIGCGDVDCSGEVDGKDSLGVVRWAAQLSPFAQCLGKGFVTCDSQLDAADAITILRFTAELESSLPASCPNGS